MSVNIYTGVFGHESVGFVDEKTVYDKTSTAVATLDGTSVKATDGTVLGSIDGLKVLDAEGTIVGHCEGDKICRGETGFDCIGHYDDVDNALAVAAYCLILEPKVRLY